MELVRESIFVSALRSFCKMFFGVLGILIAVVIFGIGFSILSPTPLIEDKTTLEIVPDAQGKKELISPTAPAILEISIHGVVGEPKILDSETIRNILIDSRKGLLSHDRVKGILLHINTPGGTVVDSDDIYRMLQTYKAEHKVPIFAFVDGLCASGGMYIASASDQIFASPSSIIGSVGVIIGPFFNASKLMETWGIESKTLTRGIDKDMMSPFRPWKEGEDASLQAVTAFMYQRFVNIVSEARPRMDKQKLVDVYGAQVFDCVKAEELGYIDHAMSNRKEALTALLKEANIDENQPYQVVSLTPKIDWISNIASGKSPLFSGKVEHRLDVGQPPIRDPFAYLYLP